MNYWKRKRKRKLTVEWRTRRFLPSYSKKHKTFSPAPHSKYGMTSPLSLSRSLCLRNYEGAVSDGFIVGGLSKPKRSRRHDAVFFVIFGFFFILSLSAIHSNLIPILFREKQWVVCLHLRRRLCKCPEKKHNVSHCGALNLLGWTKVFVYVCV